MKNSITVYYADVCGNPQNCQYSHKGTATTPEELKRCMAWDHVFIRFNGNYRNSKNFEEAVTAVLIAITISLRMLQSGSPRRISLVCFPMSRVRLAPADTI